MRRAALLVLLLLAACTRASGPAPDASAPAAAEPALTGVSPSAISNQTGATLTLAGRALRGASKLHLGSPFNRDVPLQVTGETSATARLPGDLALPAEVSEATVPLVPADEDGMLLGEGTPLTVVNDAGFTDLTALAATPDLRFAFALSPNTDEVLVLDTASGAVLSATVGDGPQALSFAVLDGTESIVVAHRFSRELRILTARPDAKGARTQRTLPAPDQVRALAVRDGIAYLGVEGASLVAVALGDGKELWRTPAVPSPRGIAVSEAAVALGSMTSGEVALFDRKTGARLGGSAPAPGVAVRALAASPSGIFAASIGPDPASGPLPCRGISLLDGSTGAFVRCLATGMDVPQALAPDGKRSRLYVADAARGLVQIGLPRAPSGGAAEVAKPIGSEASALALSPDGTSMLVLERFSDRVTRFDLRGDKPRLDKTYAVAEPSPQVDRRRGQELFFRRCEACHADGRGIPAGSRGPTAARPGHPAMPSDADEARALSAWLRALTAPGR